MIQTVRLFTISNSSGTNLQNFSEFHTETEKIAAEFPSLDFSSEDCFFHDGKELHFARKFQGPLKPADNALLKNGKVIDFSAKSAPKLINLEKTEQILKQGAGPFLILIDSSQTDLKILLYSGEDIDL